MKKAFINGKIITTDGIIWDGAVVVENGIITAADKSEKVEIPKDAEIIDVNGLYIAPGLIDIHNHGVGTSLFVDDPKSCCDLLVQHGVTTVLPTIYNNLSLEQMLNGAKLIEEVSKTGSGTWPVLWHHKWIPQKTMQVWFLLIRPVPHRNSRYASERYLCRTVSD